MPTRKKQIKKNKTMRIDDEQKKCMDKMCSQKKYEEIHKKTIVIFETLEKEFEKNLKKKDITVEEKKNLEEEIKNMRKRIKDMNKSSKKTKSIKVMQEACERLYCNKGCLGTMFEEGDPKKLPNEVIKRFKGNKELLVLLLKSRKEIFGNKTNVLKDDFYEGLKKNKVNKTKKKGAISGCVKMLPE